MTVRIHNIDLGLDDAMDRLVGRAAARIGVGADQVKSWRIARRSIDPRGRRVRWVCSVDLALEPADEERAVAAGAARVEAMAGTAPEVPQGSDPIRGRAVVVGCGPAGLMAAIRLAENGYSPLLVERGRSLAERVSDVEAFLSGADLDPESNLLYGAGGAGTFSDGKLRTRTSDPRIAEVLRRFAEAGAPPEILYDARPHVGTDRLRVVVETLCRSAVLSGVEIVWAGRATGLAADGGELCGVHTSAGFIETNALIFAAGPYARDTFEILARAGVRLEPKPFQMGLRIEHPQEIIDAAVYGVDAGHPALGAADYVLTARGALPVTSFCVCPGGTMLPAVGEPGTLCTNGMSRHRRDTGRCNGALIATVSPAEFGDDPLAGLELQRRFERAGYLAGGGNYTAPAQTAPDFLRGVVREPTLPTTYPREIRGAALDDVLPPAVAAAVRRALPLFERRIPGFAGDQALLVGPEARPSCPVRVLRDPQSRESPSLRGFYPAGAGSGHAAGIMSSAVDGLLSGESLIRRFRPPPA